MTQYISAVPLSMVRTRSGGYVNVFAGDVVPEDITDEDLQRQLKEGFLVEAPWATEADVAEAIAAAVSEKPTTIPQIMDTVGTDKALAQQYLDEENAVANPRKSLVEKLQAVLDAE